MMSMGNKYKNIVFDVGGVLIGYRPEEMLMGHGLTKEEAESFIQVIFSDPLWKDLDMEIMPYEKIVSKYEEKYPDIATHIRWFMTHIEEMRVDRPRVWEKVHQLKEAGYKLYMLSNYSSTMFKVHTEGLPFIDDMDGDLISYQIHELKPDCIMYEIFMQKYGMKPEDCLFFDDLEVNIEGAKKLGIESVWIQSEEQLLEELDKLLK